VDVEQFAFEFSNEFRSENAHEAGEEHEVRPVLPEQLRHRVVEAFAVREFAVRQTMRIDTGIARALQAMGLRLVADDGGYLDIERTCTATVDNCLQVAAAAGNEYGDARY
jgi:hypothetical protein